MPTVEPLPSKGHNHQYEHPGQRDGYKGRAEQRVEVLVVSEHASERNEVDESEREHVLQKRREFDEYDLQVCGAGVRGL